MGHPLAYFSKALGPKGQAMCTCEKELMVGVTAVKKWASYLMDKHFYIKIDRWALKYLIEQKVSNLLQPKVDQQITWLQLHYSLQKGS